MSAAGPSPRFLLVALAALLLAGSVGSGEAYACSCAASGSPSERAREDLRSADAVFTGEAVEVDRPSSPSDSGQSGATAFSVEKSWKGAPSEQVIVYGQGGAAAGCGVAFQEGERYLVYAYRGAQGEEDRLETGACDSTQPLYGAEVDLDVLGPPRTGLPETGGPISPAALWHDGAPAALLLLASLGIGAFYLHRRWYRDPR